MVKRCARWFTCLLSVALVTAGVGDARAEDADSVKPADKEKFEKYEIRVIRPRYFAKRNRLELGAELSAIMNQTFVYTYMATGLATFHFSEYLGVELGAGYGFSIDKDEKGILKNEFSIRTEIVRTQYLAGGSLLWTPIYGKFQMPSGRVVYFDTFLAAGGGMTGVYYQYDWCPGRDELPIAQQATAVDPPAATTKSYPGVSFGVGQRFFTDKRTSIKWDLRDHVFMRNSADAACDPTTAVSASKTHNNVMLQFGASRFL